MLLWKRASEQGMKQMLRERHWIVTMGTLSGICVLLQLLILSFIGVEGFQAILQEKTSLRLEMNTEATNEEIVSFISALKKLPYIDRVDRITPEKSYEIIKQKDPGLIEFLEEFNFANPFPETVQVRFSSLKDYDTFSTFITAPQWRTLIDPSFATSTSDQETYILQILVVTKAIRTGIIAFLAVAIAVLLYIIIELIRAKIIRRQEEIIIQRLCGAMHFYITLPFIIEISVLLLLATCISILIVAITLITAPFVVGSLSTVGTLNDLWQKSTEVLVQKVGWILIIQIVAIPVIAWLGTWIGTRKILGTRHLGLHRH